MKILNNKKGISPLVIGLIVLGIAIILIAGAFAAYVWLGSGNLKTESMQLDGFSRLEISSAFEVTITQSNTYNITITANERTFDRIDVTKTEDTLRIQLETGTISARVLKAEISMPTLNGVTFSGATHGTINGFSTSDEFRVDLSGASSLDMTNIQTGDFNARLSGASSVIAHGSGNDLNAELSGASSVDFSDFTINDADVEVSGASHAVVNLNGRLDVTATGASTLEYLGSPTLGDINTSGASTVRRR
jgi:hypothetical protein